eukprot:XP_001691965.1 predicted protein [Chlamydomonas reinhardtii]
MRKKGKGKRCRRSSCCQAAASRPPGGDAADDPKPCRDGGGGGKRFQGDRERSRDHGGSHPPVQEVKVEVEKAAAATAAPNAITAAASAGAPLQLQDLLVQEESQKSLLAGIAALLDQRFAVRDQEQAQWYQGQAQRNKEQAQRDKEQAQRDKEQAARDARWDKAQARQMAMLEELCDNLLGLVESTAVVHLRNETQMPVHPNVFLTDAKRIVDLLLVGVDAAGRAAALSAIVDRLRRVGPRVVVLYATSRVLADLARLLQQEEQQEPQEQQQEVEQQQEQLGPAATNSAQGLLEAVRKVRISAAAPGSAVDPDAAVAVLDAAQEYINGKKAAQAQNRNRSSSSWSDAGSNEESGGGSGGTGVRDPFDVARQLLKALGTKEQKQREQLERELLAQGAASMLVLSAMQPPKLSSAAAAERGGISGSSSGNVANVANVAAAEAAISEPATQLELNGLAVRLKKGTLRVMMLETKSGRADLPMARNQLRRAGTILAYVFNVAADAGAFGRSAPRLQLEGRIALSQLEGLPPGEKLVVLEPAEGPQHEMRECVSGLLDFGAA